MRIIKASDDFERDVNILAGEMYNIESSTLTYIDGVEQTQIVKNYPCVTIDNVQRCFRAAVGYIFICPGSPIGSLEQALKRAIKRLDEKHPDHLRDWHTTRVGCHTNLKAKFCLKGTSSIGTPPVKRMITTYRPPDKQHSRFTWVISTIDKIISEFQDGDLFEGVHQHICSIFYDASDISKFGHNDVTFTFSLSDLYVHNKIIGTDTITLLKYGCPIAVELSKYWRDKNYPKFTFRNIDASKVFKQKYENLTIAPVSMGRINGKLVYARDVCIKCKTPLYDENYVLMYNIRNPTSTAGEAICPLCLHTSQAYETDYQVVYRVTFPKTVHDMIDKYPNKELIPVLRAALKGIKTKIHYEGDTPIEYHEIGDDYIGVWSTKNIKYTSFAARQKRKICGAILID